MGEVKRGQLVVREQVVEALELETASGRLKVRWDENAQAPIGTPKQIVGGADSPRKPISAWTVFDKGRSESKVTLGQDRLEPYRARVSRRLQDGGEHPDDLGAVGVRSFPSVFRGSNLELWQ